MTKKCLISNDCSEVSTSLLKNKAIFHKKCRDKIGPQEVKRFLQSKAKRKAEEQKNEEAATYVSPKKTRRSFDSSFSRERLQCVYCMMYDDDPENTEHICKARDVGNTWLNMAKNAGNWAVYTRLCTALDNTASDLSYHKSCYTKLYTEARGAGRSSKSSDEQDVSPFDPLVIAELVAFIKHRKSELKLVDLKSLYKQRLIQVSSNWVGKTVHSTRFKEHLLQKLGNQWQFFKSENGKNLVLSRNENSAEVLLEHMSLEEEAQKIVEVGLLLRKHILLPRTPFSGKFSASCLNDSVPNSLLTLIRVLLEGAGGIGVEEQARVTARMRVALTISQLLISNSDKEISEAQQLYQIKERETPFLLYMSLVLNSSGRHKKLITNLHKAGIAVSHDRTLGVGKKLAQAVSEQFRRQKVVVPVNCKRGVFTVGTTDNIDKSGRHDMHGTSITLICQLTRQFRH